MELRLENFRDLDFHFVTPITLADGQSLVLDLVCEGVATADECDPSVFYSGFTRSTDDRGLAGACPGHAARRLGRLPPSGARRVRGPGAGWDQRPWSGGHGLPPAAHLPPPSGTTTRVSVTAKGAQATANSYQSAISADGRWVAFSFLAGTSSAGQQRRTRGLCQGPPDGRHRAAAALEGSVPRGRGQADQPSISANGEFVAFRYAPPATTGTVNLPDPASDLSVATRQGHDRTAADPGLRDRDLLGTGDFSRQRLGGVRRLWDDRIRRGRAIPDLCLEPCERAADARFGGHPGRARQRPEQPASIPRRGLRRLRVPRR